MNLKIILLSINSELMNIKRFMKKIKEIDKLKEELGLIEGDNKKKKR